MPIFTPAAFNTVDLRGIAINGIRTISNRFPMASTNGSDSTDFSHRLQLERSEWLQLCEV